MDYMEILAPVIPPIVAAMIMPPLRRLLNGTLKVIRVATVITSISILASLALLLKPGSHALGVLREPKVMAGPLTLPENLTVTFYFDAVSVIFIVISAFVCLVATIYSVGVLGEEDVPALYYSLVSMLYAGLYMIFISGDLISLFAAWELMSIATYGLIFIRRTRPLSLEAGVKYLMMSAIASGFILYAISLTYGVTGGLDFLSISSKITGSSGNLRPLYLAAAFFIAGFGFKAAVVPFHTWAPDVYQETLDPVTAILSGATSKAGVYAILRVVLLLLPLKGLGLALALLSAATMTVGNVVALLQSDVKRLLAYSSIAHMGYILMGLASGNIIGIAGAVFHAINHAIMKPLVFLCAGNLRHSLGGRTLQGLEGAGRLVVLEGFNMVIGLLSLAGIPGLNGFVSKYLLIMAAIDANLVWLAIIAIANSAVAVAYYLRVMQVLYRTPKAHLEVPREVPTIMKLPVVVLVILCFMIGVYPAPVIRACLNASQATLAMLRAS